MRLHGLGRRSCLVALLAIGLVGCTASVGDAGDRGRGGTSGGGTSGGSSSGGGSAFAVQPSVVYLAPGTTSSFRTTGTGSGAGVRWSVDESGGGTVDTAGSYEAPHSAGVFHVRASLADGSASSAARVVVTPDGGSTAPCAGAALRTTGTVYYYCDCQPGAVSGCAAGSDSNTGTLATAPRRSFSDAVTRFNGMKAGDTVAFCRGGAWTSANGTFRNSSCTASSTCDVRDYTPEGMDNAPRPVFLSGTGTFAGVLGAVTKQGYRFWNLDVRLSGGGYAFNIGDSATDIDICNVSMQGGDIAVLEQMTNQRITIRNNQISNFSGDGILAGSHDLLIDSNTFVDAGSTNSRSHSIYLQGGVDVAGGYDNERVINNDIHVTNCQGVVLVNGGRNNDALIENNRIVVDGGGCFGMGIGNGGYPYGTWHNRMTIRRNRLVMPGSGEGISVTVCADCTISDNSVALNSTSSGWIGINIADGEARTSQYADETPTTGAIVQNNSVYLPYNSGGSTGTPIRIGNEGSGHVVENNAVYTEGPASNCYAILAPTARNSNNYCRSAKGVAATALWTSPSAGDLTVASGSPLVGYGSSTSFSPTASSSAWSATDPGVTRTAPIDAGAFIH